MRKLFAVSMIVALIAGAVLLVGGCGQSNPTINTSNPQAQGLKLIGVVRTTTLNGTIGDPIAGAYVSLSGDSVNRTVVTNANGEYAFENIPDGDYTFIATAEGHTRDTSNWTLVKPSSGIPADNTITITDIQLTSNPIILSYSPIPMSVVSNRPTIVVTFNETMDATSVLPTLASAGIRTMVTGPSTIPLTGTWDSTTNPRILTLIPQADLISNETYTLTINGTAMDAAGYTVSTAREQAQELSPEFRVSCGGVPGAPGNVSVAIGTLPITSDATVGPDFANVFGTGNVGLYWTPSSGVVSGYRVYVANSATGNYHLIGTSTGNVNYMDYTMAQIITALYNGTVDPLGTGNYPMINQPLYIKVVAFNGDGESVAASTNVIELVPPRLNANVQKAPYAGTVFTADNNYALPALASNNDVYIVIREPINPSSVSTANFTIPSVTVNSVTLMTRSNSNLTFLGGWNYSILLVKTDTDLTAGGPRTLTASGLIDLAGNTMQTGVDDTVVIP